MLHNSVTVNCTYSLNLLYLSTLFKFSVIFASLHLHDVCNYGDILTVSTEKPKEE